MCILYFVSQNCGSVAHSYQSNKFSMKMIRKCHSKHYNEGLKEKQSLIASDQRNISENIIKAASLF